MRGGLRSTVRLRAVGLAGLEGVDVVAAEVSPHADVPWGREGQAAPDAGRLPRGRAGRALLRDFERRTARLEELIERHDPGVGWSFRRHRRRPGPEPQPARPGQPLPQGRANTGAPLDLVLRRLPASDGSWSSGTAWARDCARTLLRRLPPEVEVAGLVTIGSPIAHQEFHAGKLKDLLPRLTPPTSPGGSISERRWTWSPPIAARRRVPVDPRPAAPLAEVPARLGGPTWPPECRPGGRPRRVGSTSTELAVIERTPDVTLEAVEIRLLLALRYAHFVHEHLEGERQARYGGALGVVQERVARQVIDAYLQQGKARPSFGRRRPGPEVGVPIPVTISSLDSETALEHLSSSARPQPAHAVRDQGRHRGTPPSPAGPHGLDGLGSRLGGEVFDAYRTAEKSLRSGGRGLEWVLLGVAALSSSLPPRAGARRRSRRGRCRSRDLRARCLRTRRMIGDS